MQSTNRAVYRPKRVKKRNRGMVPFLLRVRKAKGHRVGGGGGGGTPTPPKTPTNRPVPNNIQHYAINHAPSSGTLSHSVIKYPPKEVTAQVWAMNRYLNSDIKTLTPIKRERLSKDSPLKALSVNVGNVGWAKRFDSIRGSLKFVLSGTQGGGTGFISQVLNSVGHHCGHENVLFGRGEFRPPYFAEVSWMCAPYLSDPFFNGIKKIQLLRHPVKVVQSNFNLGCGNDASGLLAFYCRWHELLEYSDIFYTHRVEDDPKNLLGAMGIVCNGNPMFSNTSYNSKKRFQKKKLTLGDFTPEGIKNLEETCNKYGYILERGFD